MPSSVRRWFGTFRRAAGKQESLRHVQDELAEALDAAEAAGDDAPSDNVVQDLTRKGYDQAQVEEFFAPPPPPEPKKP